MAVKKQKIEHLDRVRRPSETTATATVISTHGTDSKTVAYSVLLDSGPMQTHVWPASETIRVSGRMRTCTRCSSQDHTTIYCKEAS